MTKKRGIIIIIILLMISVAWWYLSSGEREEEILPHHIGTVTSGDLNNTISVSGHLAPIREKAHQPLQGGKIKEILVEPGDRVKYDDVLFRLNDREQHLNYLQAKNSYQQALINGTEREIEEREISLELAEKNLEDRIIRSRLEGTVAEFDFEEGDYVTSESGTISVRDENGYIVKVNVDEIDIFLISEGMDSIIEIDALPENSYPGKVKYIESGTIRDNGVVVTPVEVEILENDKQFRPGISADIDIIIEARENVLTVPATAIYEQEGQEYVIKIEAEKPQPTAVSTGLSDDIEVEISSGINENDRILINVHQYISYGEPDWQFGPGAGPPPGTPGAQNRGGPQ